MKDEKLEKLVSYVESVVGEISGNVFSQATKSMVSTRLKKRMMELSISDCGVYLDYIKDNRDELTTLVGRLTTHHTFFFREYVHFEFLKENLESICKQVRVNGETVLKVWSSAASRGHEGISLALFLDHYLPKIAPDLTFEIFCTDIDSDSVSVGRNGIYPYREVKSIPSMFLEGNWLRGKGKNSTSTKLKPNILKYCHFDTANLLELDHIKQKFDIIFCRNVLIYFDRETTQKVIHSLGERLNRGGILVTGVSEPISRDSSQFKKVGPCIYSVEQNGNQITKFTEKSKAKIRVVNVDDSPSVLKILKKMFDSLDDYDLVGQCKDGNELVDFLKENDVDIITLDLHMPNLDGVGFLRSHYREDDPPVVVVSSVSRDNIELAKEALILGAVDYVEKPSIDNFKKSSEEIINKITVALASGRKKEVTPIKKEKSKVVNVSSNVNTIKVVESFLFCSSEDLVNISSFIKDMVKSNIFPGYFILASLNKRLVDSINDTIRKSLPPGQERKGLPVYEILSLSSFIEKFSKKLLEGGKSLCFFKGALMNSSIPKAYLQNNYILCETRPLESQENVHVMPSTSWSFHVYEFFFYNGFQRDVFVPMKNIEGKTTQIEAGESVIVFYNSNALQVGLCILSNVTQLSKVIQGLSPENYFGCKVLSNKLGLKNIRLVLSNHGIKKFKPIEIKSSIQIKILKSKLFFTNALPVLTKPVTASLAPVVEQRKKARVLIIDDSPTMSKALDRLVSRYDCVAETKVVNNPLDVEGILKSYRPDIITLDVNMPEMNGPELFNKVIKSKGIPTIVLTSSSSECDDVMNLLSDGATDYLQKDNLSSDNSVFPLKSMIEYGLLQRQNKFQNTFSSRIKLDKVATEDVMIAIGSSTGGTKALHQIFSQFPTSFPPVLVGQHIPAGFSNSFAKSLNRENLFTVKEAQDNDLIENSTVYIAPGGKNMGIVERNNQYFISISSESNQGKYDVPSIDYLFESIASIYKSRVVSVILTGMGKDGSEGMKALFDKGAYTIAQDEASCVVFGMPKVAIAKGVVEEICSLDDMASLILSSTQERKSKKIA